MKKRLLGIFFCFLLPMALFGQEEFLSLVETLWPIDSLVKMRQISDSLDAWREKLKDNEYFFKKLQDVPAHIALPQDEMRCYGRILLVVSWLAGRLDTRAYMIPNDPSWPDYNPSREIIDFSEEMMTLYNLLPVYNYLMKQMRSYYRP